MSDLEPESKRIIDQLLEYSEPYQPGAWEHFERLREKRKRKRRVVIYWLNAAAVLVIFGTVILVNQLMPSDKAIKKTISANKTKTDKVSGKENLEKLSSSEHTGSVNASTGLEGTRITFAYEKKSQIRIREHLLPNEIANADQKKEQELAGLYLLQIRPFTAQNVYFNKLYIPLMQQHSEPAARVPNPVRLGITLAQQSNQAASTHPEMNYGVGGALYFPLTQKMTLITGTSGSKQSLNVEKDAVVSMPLNGFAQLQRARYHWFNVEVPIHLQYSLRTFKKAGITAVGGFSVLGSVGQISDYLYKTSRTITTYTETSGGPVVVSTKTVEDFSSVREDHKKGSWVFGGALYLGFGFNYQFKNYDLGIEPYAKYPIGPITAAKLQFTSLGVQLKLTGLISKPR
ncbi:hypothetical protein [Dyadobacter chenhuakuii]|uniref:Outer membrane protein with beta-barrel domain n=1 Tax=Dyadobacter chenhuakuii TaxID=2909339 RepID=A0A9X1Q8P4_9BACT|nr:hypothetical protein [Dyadobacter chenhuakuii]MCF2496671.1 hypothetical protein [Dyadobacter chenhuakuii]